jgi:alpha-galactosidase
MQFPPPEIMGSDVGAAPAHSTGRKHPIELRAAVAATGHIGLELDICTLNANERMTIKSWIDFDRCTRNLIHGGDIWLGEAGEGVLWEAHGSPDDFLLFVFRINPTSERYAPTVRLPMAKPAIRYKVSLAEGWQRRGWISGGGSFADLAGAGADIRGAWLREAGLALPPMLAESAVVFRFSAL